MGITDEIVERAGEGVLAIAVLVSMTTSMTYQQAVERVDRFFGEIIGEMGLADMLKSLDGIDFKEKNMNGGDGWTA